MDMKVVTANELAHGVIVFVLVVPHMVQSIRSITPHFFSPQLDRVLSQDQEVVRDGEADLCFHREGRDPGTQIRGGIHHF